MWWLCGWKNEGRWHCLCCYRLRSTGMNTTVICKTLVWNNRISTSVLTGSIPQEDEDHQSKRRGGNSTGSTSRDPYVRMDWESELGNRTNLEQNHQVITSMTFFLMIMTLICIHSTSISCVLSASLQASPKLAPPIVWRCSYVCVNGTWGIWYCWLG